MKVFAGKETKFVIKENIDLGGKTVKIGEGCMLVFKGGSLANGKVVGNRTKVVNDVQLNNCIFRNIEQKYVIVNARKLDINNNVFE